MQNEIKSSVEALNIQIESLKNKEDDILNQIKEIKESSNVTKKDSNKLPKHWPFSTYLKCFSGVEDFEKYKLLIPTVAIRLESNGTVYGPFKAMLDTGAQPTMISHSLFSLLKCQTTRTSRQIIGIDSQPFSITRKFNINIRPWFDSNVCIEETVLVLPEKNEWNPVLPSVLLDVSHNDFELEQPLADPNYFKPAQVNIVLGVGFFAKMINKAIGTANDGTTLLDTSYGVVLMGEHTESMETVTNTSFSIIRDVSGEKLNGMLEKLWEQDRIETVENTISDLTEEERMVEEHFINTYRRDDEGRFIVKIPFKPNIGCIGSSRQTALRRFFNMEKRLNGLPDLKEFYVEQMRESIRNGHMKEVNRGPAPGKICYHIPHHCVQKKPRVVFDASCKTSTGVSLNEAQMLGPKLQTDLHLTLMRFRRHKIAVCADIKKMFNQIKVSEDQWDCQRIFWRENSDQPLKEYWLTVVTFGLTSSAYLSVKCVIQAAREAAEQLPNAAKIIERDFYMDDCVTGADSVEQAIKLASEIDQILSGAAFKLRKWKSNSFEVQQAFGSVNEDSEQCIVFSEDGETSVLGVKWLLEKDQFTFLVKTPALTLPLTKRRIVSSVAQLYDPDGYIAPVVVTGKIIIQQLWKQRIEWDTVVDQQIEKVWKELWNEIVLLEKFRIDRWIGTSAQTKSKLIGFADSSKAAYGGLVYVRTEYPNGTIKCNLLTSKSRVAPIKELTIPRLELAAAEILARLVTEVKKSMEFDKMEYYLYTDSAIVLHWIRKPPAALKVYAANRVKSIQEKTDIRRWRYVNTKENPADLLSRGAMPSELVGNALWLHGPQWLLLPESQWPQEQFPIIPQTQECLEMRVHCTMSFSATLTTSDEQEPNKRISVMEYADKLEKALRILGYASRYVHAFQTKYKPPKRNSRAKMIIHPPTRQEKAWAMECMVRQSQREYFNSEITALTMNKSLPLKSKLEPLKPFLDQQKILRVGGRLEYSELDYETKHPAIIPKGSRLAWLLMDFAHRANRHGAIQVMIQHIRQLYWIPQIKDELKKFSRTCIECVRQAQEVQEQLMGELPPERVRPGRPFESTGVDYAGPFAVKFVDKRNKITSTYKGWTVVFVCMKTRAVHLDLVMDLTSASFIACFTRFISRRGNCYKLFSDNGKSFVGAERPIANAYKEWQRDGTVDAIANKGTQWNFMAPAAPHQGGIYEAAVKSMKFHLKRVVRDKIMDYEQFITLLCEIEAVLNSRPLTPLSGDPTDLQALTPGHFLIMEQIVSPPPFEFPAENDAAGKKLWDQRRGLLKHFWIRWKNEYLTTLQQRKKWRREKENVKVGQLVLLKDEDQPPSFWKLARIKELLPGKDGLVRNVIVETEKSIFKRPIQKICVLPVDCAEQ